MNTFTTGTTILPTPVNQNFSYLVTSLTNVDNSQIGSAGIYPSQLIPTTVGQATFGGSGAGLNYTFPGNVTTSGQLSVGATTITGNATITGNVTVSGYVGSGGSYVPAVYTFGNGALATTTKMLTGTVTVGAGTSSLTFSLSNGAAFTNNATYWAVATCNAATTTVRVLSCTKNSGSSVTVVLDNNAPAGGSQVDVILVGY